MEASPNGAQALIRTLVGCGVEACFTNPGTSEMHFVAALDAVPEMRAVLALFEGVASGAADGYGRMTGRPAATLLHLGPGLGNAIANLHNARRAHTPVVNIVGDHATYHRAHDAPLQSDIESLARNVSTWIRSSASAGDVGPDAAAAVAAALTPPGGVATLILPADVSWSPGAAPSGPAPVPAARVVSDEAVRAAATALTAGEPAALLLGGAAVRDDAGLAAAARVAAASAAPLLCETFPARLARGAGRPVVERLPYLAEMAQARLAEFRHLVLVGAAAPVSFFAYPGKPSVTTPDACEIHVLAAPGDDPVEALQQLADELGAARDEPVTAAGPAPERPQGAIDFYTAATAVAAALPEGAIVSDEGNTAGLWASPASAGAPPHDWLTLTGGSIGQGLPVATGAAVACPDRPVVCLEADGSALYTLQALWTQAREQLDVTTVLFNNRSYAILALELQRVGADPPGPLALGLFDLSRPPIDFVALAGSLGVPATRPETAEDLTVAIETAIAEPGPHLVEVVLPSRL